MTLAATGNLSIGSTTDLGYKLGIFTTSTAVPSLYLRSNVVGDVGTAQIRLIKTDATNTTSQIFIQFVIDANNTNSGQINANGASHQIGFIAQEMEQVYPDAIGVGDDEMLTVTGWSKTEARLVKAIQELKTEFDAYKALHP
jgi:hypothetical protein